MFRLGKLLVDIKLEFLVLLVRTVDFLVLALLFLLQLCVEIIGIVGVLLVNGIQPVDEVRVVDVHDRV